MQISKRCSTKILEPIDHVVGMCEAYINHHRRYPGTVSIMFRQELLDNDNAELLETRPKSFRLLKDAVRRAISEDVSEVMYIQISQVLTKISQHLYWYLLKIKPVRKKVLKNLSFDSKSTICFSSSCLSHFTCTLKAFTF